MTNDPPSPTFPREGGKETIEGAFRDSAPSLDDGLPARTRLMAAPSADLSAGIVWVENRTCVLFCQALMLNQASGGIGSDTKAAEGTRQWVTFVAGIITPNRV